MRVTCQLGLLNSSYNPYFLLTHLENPQGEIWHLMKGYFVWEMFRFGRDKKNLQEPRRRLNLFRLWFLPEQIGFGGLSYTQKNQQTKENPVIWSLTISYAITLILEMLVTLQSSEPFGTFIHTWPQSAGRNIEMFQTTYLDKKNGRRQSRHAREFARNIVMFLYTKSSK